MEYRAKKVDIVLARNASTGVWTDYTAQAKDATINDIALPPYQTTVADDCLYFGFEREFDWLRFKLSTAGPTVPHSWEYSKTDGTWPSLSGLSDGTSGFTVTGTKEVTFTKPTDWGRRTISDLVQPYYFIRYRITTTPTATGGSGDQAWIIDPILIWAYTPSTMEEEPRYRTLVTAFESGLEQRRAKRHRPITRFTLAYELARLTLAEKNSIWADFDRLWGSYESFLLPSFQEEMKVKSAYTSGTTLQLDSTDLLTTAISKRGYRIYLENAQAEHETTPVKKIVDHDTIEIPSELKYDYGAGDKVCLCYLVRFADDGAPFSIESPFQRSARFNFVEVLE